MRAREEDLTPRSLARSQVAGASTRRARVPPDQARLLPRHRRRVAPGAPTFLFVQSLPSSAVADARPSPSPQLCIEHFRQDFIELSTQLSAVVACRCSPTQKADVARLIREHTKKRVCCIGDGGNDVSMIQAADVGASLPHSVPSRRPSCSVSRLLMYGPAHGTQASASSARKVAKRRSRPTSRSTSSATSPSSSSGTAATRTSAAPSSPSSSSTAA